MKAIPILLVGILGTLVVAVCLLIGIKQSQGNLMQSLGGASPVREGQQPVPAGHAGIGEDQHRRDVATLVAMLDVVRRQGDPESIEVQILHLIRSIDQDAYFAEIMRLASEDTGRAMTALNDGEWINKDSRYVPIIRTLGTRMNAAGAYDSGRLAGIANYYADSTLHPVIVTAAHGWIDRGNPANLTPVDAAWLVSSGLPLVHAEIIRWLREYPTSGIERQRIYRRLSDMYVPTRPLPWIEFPRKDKQALPEAEATVLRDFQRWVSENHRLLVYDPAAKTMRLAATPDEARQWQAKEASTSSAPSSNPTAF
jgi:hypothetical protein